MAKEKPLIDNKAIVENIDRLLAQLDEVLPHINTAHNAFGTMEDVKAQHQSLRNQLLKARVAYAGQ